MRHWRCGVREFVERARTATHLGHLVVSEDGGIAGVININEVVGGSFCSGYLGYDALAPYQGQGYMHAGLKAVIRKAFGDYGLYRLEANIQPDNLRSIGLVRTLGFRQEGYSPKYLKIGGRWRDHERWALTVEDWRPRER